MREIGIIFMDYGISKWFYDLTRHNLFGKEAPGKGGGGLNYIFFTTLFGELGEIFSSIEEIYL